MMHLQSMDLEFGLLDHRNKVYKRILNDSYSVESSGILMSLRTPVLDATCVAAV